MKSLSAVTLWLVALVAAAPAQADIRTTLFGVQNFSSVPYAPTFCAGCITQWSNTDTYNRGTSTLSLFALADYGMVKTSAAVSGGGLGVQASGSATLTVFDMFTIDAAGLTGRDGFFTAQVAMPFTSSYDNRNAAAGEGLTSSVVVNGIESYGLQAGTNETGSRLFVEHNSTEVSPDAPMVLNVPFVYGVPMSILMFMDASVSGSTGPGPEAGSFNLVMDAAHSMYWEGISSVTDGAGRAVIDYTLTSDSGTDWTRSFAPAAVPEPATGLLMLAGLGALGMRRRSAAHRRAADRAQVLEGGQVDAAASPDRTRPPSISE